jgi:Txe/YoeB family toxin of Txe-Axe toxin-antitoxin module
MIELLIIKCFDIIRSINDEPREGIAKPERLKYFDHETWSRRINKSDNCLFY